MSIEASKRVWAHSKASGSALVVALALADFANDELEAWPSQATLARLAKVSDRQVRNILQELIDLGDIAVAGTGRRGVMVYKITCGIADPSTTTPEAGFLTPEMHFRPSTPEVGFLTPEVGFRGGDATPEIHFRQPRKPASDEPSRNHQDKDSVEAAFAEFWNAYPSRSPHPNPKKPALQKFTAAVKAGADPAVIIDAVRQYATAIEQAKTDPKYVCQAQTWLGQQRWNDQQAATSPQQQGGGDTLKGWRHPVTGKGYASLAGQGIWTLNMGPRPGLSGCEAPQEVQNAFLAATGASR